VNVNARLREDAKDLSSSAVFAAACHHQLGLGAMLHDVPRATVVMIALYSLRSITDVDLL